MIKFINELFVFGLLMLIVISCGRKEFTEAGIDETVEEINKLLEDAEGKQFDWGNPKAYSYYRAYFNNDDLIFINEDLQYRFPKDEFNRYYFKDDNLIYFIGKSYDTNYKIRLDVTVYFDPNGNAIRYDKLKNGTREQLTGDEADQILEHANELFNNTNEKLSSKH